MNEKHKMETGDRRDILAEQWDSSNPKPFDSFTPGSKYRAVWQCPLGHKWSTLIAVRYGGSDCPYCKSRRVLSGFNDLAKRSPEVAKEWHPTKNGSLKPSDVMPNSLKKVWWKCGKCGHEWFAGIQGRFRGSGCPVCAKRAPSQKENVLAQYPEVAKEWNYEKNKKGPDEYRPFSNVHVWWKCGKCGYEWPAVISSRTGYKRGCPRCAGQVPTPGKTDLATTNPELIAEWDCSRNDLSIQEVSKGSNRKVWWICPNGHHYQAKIAHRVCGEGCPQCAGRRKLF